MRKRKYCEFCCNATVEPGLNHDNDFSSMSEKEIEDSALGDLLDTIFLFKPLKERFLADKHQLI